MACIYTFGGAETNENLWSRAQAKLPKFLLRLVTSEAAKGLVHGNQELNQESRLNS